jgi:hypothetical protein
MNLRRRVPATCLVLAAAAFAAAAFASAQTAAPTPTEALRNHFDADSIMRAPGFFDLVVLGEPAKRTRWLILADPNSPSAPYRLAQVESARPDGSIAAALRRNVQFQDGSVSTFVKNSPSRAGFVLRMAGEKDFLLLLVEPQSGDLVLSSYRDGKATELGRGKVSFARGWETLGATLAGGAVTVTFNDAKVFAATDPHPASGRVGLATTGAGEASFDEFIIRPAAGAPQKSP